MGLAEGQIEFNLSMFLGYFNILLYDSRFMKLVASKPARLHCPNCDATYSLPAGGSFKLFNELKCPLDEFELLLWVGGPNGKGYPFCPYCYVYPPFRYRRICNSTFYRSSKDPD